MTTTTPTGTITSQEFRHVIGHFLSGVTVITTSRDGAPVGTTVSALTSLSLDPPLLIVCMNKTSETGRAVKAGGTFAVNMLADSQEALAVRFATKGDDKFTDLDFSTGQFGQPLLNDALAYLECRVVEQTDAGTHSVFIAEVATATARSGDPLAYYRGLFGRLASTR